MLLFQGTYYQVGDIVSLVDHDGGVYYAQLRGFLCDQYSEKSAVITWLLPTQSSPTDRFEASTFVLGKYILCLWYTTRVYTRYACSATTTLFFDDACDIEKEITRAKIQTYTSIQRTLQI